MKEEPDDFVIRRRTVEETGAYFDGFLTALDFVRRRLKSRGSENIEQHIQDMIDQTVVLSAFESSSSLRLFPEGPIG